MSSTIYYRALSEESENIVEKMNALIAQAGLRKPIKPFEPIKPKKPYLSLEVKPSFLDLKDFIFLGFLVAIPVFIIWIINDNYLIPTFIIFFIIFFSIQIYQYNTSRTSYNRKVKDNKVKLMKYDHEVEIYKQKFETYKRTLQVYNSAIEDYKKEYENNKPLQLAIEKHKKELSFLLSPVVGDEANGFKPRLRDLYKEYLPQNDDDFTNSYQNSRQHLQIPKSNDYSKVINYLNKLSSDKKTDLLKILEEVKEIQNSGLSTIEKTEKIKQVLWMNRSRSSKLVIGGLLGTVFGLTIFGTGGIGVAALGGAVGIWGWLASAAGGVFISSLIQNFEKPSNS